MKIKQNKIWHICKIEHTPPNWLWHQIIIDLDLEPSRFYSEISFYFAFHLCNFRSDFLYFLSYSPFAPLPEWSFCSQNYANMPILYWRTIIISTPQDLGRGPTTMPISRVQPPFTFRSPVTNPALRDPQWTFPRRLSIAPQSGSRSTRMATGSRSNWSYQSPLKSARSMATSKCSQWGPIQSQRSNRIPHFSPHELLSSFARLLVNNLLLFFHTHL